MQDQSSVECRFAGGGIDSAPRQRSQGRHRRPARGQLHIPAKLKRADRSMVNAPIGDHERSGATLVGRSALELALLSA
jgi:hypothetical protein